MVGYEKVAAALGNPSDRFGKTGGTGSGPSDWYNVVAVRTLDWYTLHGWLGKW